MNQHKACSVAEYVTVHAVAAFFSTSNGFDVDALAKNCRH